MTTNSAIRRGHSFTSHVLGILVYVSILAVYMFSGMAAVDFGYHWDEFITLDGVKSAFKSWNLLPANYLYPGMIFVIGLCTAAAKMLAISPGQIDTYLASHDFTLLLRSVFFTVCSLSSTAVVLCSYRLGLGLIPSLFSGALVLGSWEFFSHARWIASDAIMATFFIISICLMICSLTQNSVGIVSRLGLLLLAAAASGLCVSSKYPGGVVLVPLLIAVHKACRIERIRGRDAFLTYLFVISAFTITYFAISPGTIIQPRLFIRDLFFNVFLYGNEGFFGYTVDNPLDHFIRLFEYLSLVAFSRIEGFAVILFGVISLGTFRMIKESPYAVLLLSAPTLYLFVFVSQKVMIVRNYMFFIPFMAVAFAFGINYIITVANRGRWLGSAALFFFMSLMLVNIYNVYETGRKILRSNPEPAGDQIIQFISKHNKSTFYVYPRAASLASNRTAALSNTTENPAEADFILFSSSDASSLQANRHNLYTIVSSSFDDVNFNYYPTWTDSRLVLALSTKDKAFSAVGKIIGPARKAEDLTQPQ